jgi:hypothetical protein
MPVNYSAPFSRFPVAERDGPGALRRVAYPFRTTIGAGASRTIKLPIPRDGTVERITVRFYVGTELGVRVVPYVVSDTGTVKQLLTFPKDGKTYIDGEDDRFIFEIREPVFVGTKEVLCVDFVNTTDAQTGFAYDVAVDIEIDHAAGAWPLVYIPTGEAT